jgi:hypothetical protein
MSEKEIMQKYFNIMVAGLEAQGWQRCMHNNKYSENVCIWAQPSDPSKRCAIGHLLKKEDIFSVAVEKQDLGKAIESSFLPEDLMEIVNNGEEWSAGYRLVYDCQAAHDTDRTTPFRRNGPSMKDHFRQIAKEFGLDWPLDETSHSTNNNSTTESSSK